MNVSLHQDIRVSPPQEAPDPYPFVIELPEGRPVRDDPRPRRQQLDIYERECARLDSECSWLLKRILELEGLVPAMPGYAERLLAVMAEAEGGWRAREAEQEAAHLAWCEAHRMEIHRVY